jgi:hypothetical protein
MNKTSIDFKKWSQICLPSEENPNRVKSDLISIENLSGRPTIAQCGQFSVAAMFAGGFYLLNIRSGDGVWLLAALAATSTFVYVGLAMQSRTGTMALFNLLAIPIIFATAYAGMSAAGWLIFSFLLHGSITALQLSSLDKGLTGGLFFWSAFNSTMALFLLLG